MDPTRFRAESQGGMGRLRHPLPQAKLLAQFRQQKITRMNDDDSNQFFA
jgi:hypothetical protein